MKKVISIRNRIIRLVMVVSTVIIGITALLFSLFTISIFKNNQKDSLLAGMGFTAAYCVPSLLFDDPNGASQVLQNYSAMPQVLHAVLLDDSGANFASYSVQGHIVELSPVRALPEYTYLSGKLALAVAVMSDNEKIGELHMLVSTKEMTNMLYRIAGSFAMVVPLLLLFAYLFGSRLQKRISGPILRLSAVAEQVRYGSAIPVIDEKEAGASEIVSLNNRFREMLERITAGEKELVQASEFLHTIVDSMPSLLIVASREKVITLCNESAVYYCDQGHPLQMNLFFAFPFLELLSNEIDQVLSENRKQVLRGVTVNAKTIKQCDIELFPLNYEEQSGVVISLTDVTELAQKDQQLVQIQKMETVGSLAGGLAHDFNNILSGIVGTLSLMEYQNAESINFEELKEYVAIMNHAGDRAKEMIDHLLSLSHKSDTSYGTVDLKDIAFHAIRFCEHSFDKKIRIAPLKIGENCYVRGNATQLEQVVLNLCVNACHAMTMMRDDVDSYGGDLSISVESRGEMICLVVRDSGVGIPEENLTQIFDPFFTTKGKGKGTGLGLSMVNNIVNQHGGLLQVESTVGKGTVITIELPRVDSGTDVLITPSGIKTDLFGTGKTVLIIDDDVQIRTVAQKMISRLGFTVVITEDGFEGIDYFTESHNSVDLVLLDMVMPGMSGKEVFVKLQEIDSRVPVILSSGFGQDDRVLDTLRLGVRDFLHKPYTMNELCRVLEKCIFQTNLL